ncbi:hypothetical protein [Streptomyces albidoflavus]|uniref:hypothetical protein n=1 Tax=Streptomyces albidoflavus TaxID=1886 RepID=UPI004056AE59
MKSTRAVSAHCAASVRRSNAGLSAGVPPRASATGATPPLPSASLTSGPGAGAGPETASAQEAATATRPTPTSRPLRRRLSRSVGRVCTWQGSNSWEASSTPAASPVRARTPAASFSAASGSATPAAASSAATSSVPSSSRASSAKAALAGAETSASTRSSASSSVPPARGKNRSPHTAGSPGRRARGGGRRRGQSLGRCSKASAADRTWPRTQA